MQFGLSSRCIISLAIDCVKKNIRTLKSRRYRQESSDLITLPNCAIEFSFEFRDILENCLEFSGAPSNAIYGDLAIKAISPGIVEFNSAPNCAVEFSVEFLDILESCLEFSSAIPENPGIKTISSGIVRFNSVPNCAVEFSVEFLDALGDCLEFSRASSGAISEDLAIKTIIKGLVDCNN